MEDLPSKATSVQEMTALPASCLRQSCFSNGAYGVTLMESSREKSGGVGDETYMPPSALGTGENPNMRICDLEPYIEQEQKAFRIKETARPSNRRRMLRVYIPSLPLK